MNQISETDYHLDCDKLFTDIESMLDDADIDFDSNGNVIEAELDDGGKIIINRQTAAREVWIAAAGGGFHFLRAEDGWRHTRDNRDLMEILAELIKTN